MRGMGSGPPPIAKKHLTNQKQDTIFDHNFDHIISGELHE